MEQIMTINDAKKILEAYLNGIDLETGEQLQIVSFNPILFNAIKKIISPSRAEIQTMLNESCGYPRRRGFSWSTEEDNVLIKNFNLGQSYQELAEFHQRSKTAISKRLFALGLAKDLYETPNFSKFKKFSIHIN